MSTPLRLAAVPLLSLLFTLPAVAQFPGGSQGIVCNTNVSVTPQLRGESASEMTGDITVSCTGGTVLSAGALIPSANIQVFYNAAVTSRLLPVAGDPASSNFSE